MTKGKENQFFSHPSIKIHFIFHNMYKSNTTINSLGYTFCYDVLGLLHGIYDDYTHDDDGGDDGNKKYKKNEFLFLTMKEWKWWKWVKSDINPFICTTLSPRAYKHINHFILSSDLWSELSVGFRDGIWGFEQFS